MYVLAQNPFSLALRRFLSYMYSYSVTGLARVWVLISKVKFSLPNNSIIIVCPQMYKQEVEDLKAEFSRAEFLAKVK